MFERIAVLSPTTIQFVEKMAALCLETGIDVVGPPHPDQWGWNNYERRMEEWRRLGLTVRLDLRPYAEIDFSRYDLLIETYETLFIEPSWQEHCHRYECPTVVKVWWTGKPWFNVPRAYFDKIKTTPILVRNLEHLRNWETSGFWDVSVEPDWVIPQYRLSLRSVAAVAEFHEIFWRARKVREQRCSEQNNYRFRPSVISRFDAHYSWE